MDTQTKIACVTGSLNSLLLEKNKRYGDSALNPLKIFGKHIITNPDPAENQADVAAYNNMLARLDDKLKRIQTSDHLRKNDVADVMGYLVLLCANLDWTDFSDLVD